MQELERKIYDVLAKSEVKGGLGSSETASNLINVARPFYAAADESGRKQIVNRLNALRKEPGIPLPDNLNSILEK